MKRNNFSVEEE